jgi:hypothetical protein
MILTFLSHQWKSFIRSRGAGRNIAVQIFIGFIVLYSLTSAIVFGLSINTILQKQFPKQDTIKIFCGFILYYFSFEIIARFMVQNLPTLIIQPYLIQNIKRKTLINFLNSRSLFTLFNLLPFAIFIPFSATVIAAKFGSMRSFVFVMDLFLVSMAIHFFIMFIKRKIIFNSWWLAGFLAAIIIFAGADYLHIFSIRNLSGVIFFKLIESSWLVIVVLVIAVVSFYNNYHFLKRNLYLDLDNDEKRNVTNFNWLDQFGITGELSGIELKMMLRNKRPRTVLLMSFIFLLYGFIFYKQPAIDKNEFGSVITGALFITGIFIINYGQFMLAWQSAHFDGMMSLKISTKEYLKAKLILMISMSTISFLVSLAYGFMRWKIIPVEIVAYLFNISVNVIVLSIFATRNYKGIDISKKASFNYEGMGSAQWIYSIVIFGIGLVMYLPFALLFSSFAGIIAIGIFSVIMLVMYYWWFDVIIAQFKKNKYKILEGFREK